MNPSQNQFPNSSQSAPSSQNRPDDQASPSQEPALPEAIDTPMDQQPNATLDSATSASVLDSESASESLDSPPDETVDEPTPLSTAETEVDASESSQAEAAPVLLMKPKPIFSAPSPQADIDSVPEKAPLSPVAKPGASVESQPVSLAQPAEEIAPLEDAAASETDTSEDHSDDQPAAFRQQPIPPASEPMQYRAIGLVRGRYEPSEEQFTRGFVYTEDGQGIDAVLLGRVMSLVKKHIDLTQPHLWVVYPRTREKNADLHIQIVGVWEPEKLNRSGSAADEATANEEEATATEEPAPGSAEAIASPDYDDGYFSIRGEVLFQSQEDERLVIKIQQAPRKGSTMAKAFKLNLKGTLTGKAVGYFWDLHVQRQENLLVVQEGHSIGLVPPKKRKGGSGGDRKRRPPNKAGGGQAGRRKAPYPGRPADRAAPSSPPTRRDPVAKPIKRRENPSQ